MRNNNQSLTGLSETLNAERRIVIQSSADVKKALMLRHGTLSKAARDLDVPYNQLSDVLNGRLRTSYILAAFKEDLSLTDAQIDALFPKPMSAREFKLAQASA